MLVEECEPQRALRGSGREGGERQSKRKEPLHKEGAISSVEDFGGRREMRTVQGGVTGEPLREGRMYLVLGIEEKQRGEN